MVVDIDDVKGGGALGIFGRGRKRVEELVILRPRVLLVLILRSPSEAGNGTARLVVVGIDEALVVLTASPDYEERSQHPDA